MSQPAPIQHPFTASLRARPGITIRLGASDAPTVTIRVELTDVWDVVRLEVPLDEPVINVKLAALEVLGSSSRHPDEYVMKLNGFEVLDEQSSVAATGARDGSIYLLTSRRRIPVR